MRGLSLLLVKTLYRMGLKRKMIAGHVFAGTIVYEDFL
jgi:hypothetical protein